MGDLNLEAFLWVITLILWLFLYLFGRRNRQEALAAESPHPHMSDLGGPLNRRLRQAGLSSNGLGMLQYWSGKIGSAAGLALMALLIARIRSQPVAGTTLITMALIGFVLPDFWINGLRKRRMQKVRASLSFYLDLVVALLRAGLPVNRALFKAAHDGFNDP
ncbi:MAG: Flp pilus assembly protein TadB, partial [Verrucomicrobiales bacterium]